MAEIARVKIEQEKDGEIKATNEFSVEMADTGEAVTNDQWIPLHLEIETRIESIWYKFLPDILDFSPLTNYREFKESEEFWIWFEMGNMLGDARTKLLRARGYKEVEKYYLDTERPQQILRIIHFRMMDEFHGALKAIKKLEDLIARLIFEAADRSFDSIKTTRKEWERQLTLKNIKAGVEDRGKNAVLSAMPDPEYRELEEIVNEMRRDVFPEMEAFWEYRHALEHRMPLSVDYREIYPYYKPLLEADWQFLDLFSVAVKVYEHYYKLLERLAQLSISNHPAYRRP